MRKTRGPRILVRAIIILLLIALLIPWCASAGSNTFVVIIGGIPVGYLIDYGSGPVEVQTYSFESSVDLVAGQSFVLLGSNDGVSFTLLDSQSGIAFSTGVPQSFVIASSASYRFYEIDLTGGFSIPGATLEMVLNYPSPPASPSFADFVANQSSGPRVLGVQFNDTSTGGVPISWLWNFGDGTTSTVQNATHNFQAIRLYTVSLTVLYAGGSSTKTMVINVTAAWQRPKATATIPTLQERHIQYLEAIGGNATNYTGIGFDPFVLLGVVFASLLATIGEPGMVLLYALPFIMMVIAHQGRMTMSAIVGIPIGLYIIVRLPGQYQLFAVSTIGIAFAGMIYGLYTEH